VKIVQRFFWVHLLVAMAALAIGFYLAQQWILSVIVLLLGAWWANARRRHTEGLEGVMLYLFLLGGVIAILSEAPPLLILLVAVATLGAWDLDNFLQRLGAAERVEFDTILGRDHLKRLGTVEGIGFLAAGLALTARIEVGFWWLFLLGLLVAIGINRLVARIRKETE
jgi:hypothetical protein